MINFPELEEKILKFWQDKNIFKKTLEKKSVKGPFIFYEGPPTANGKPGIHHVLARAFKDLIPRYKTMQGYFVERKAGWDTHGLPVELEVEKKLKISGKPDIEKFGIEKFNSECKESVWRYQEEWEKLTERIAFWLDLEHPYITYHKDYIETLWWIFKKVHERGLLYQGHKVVPQCPRCGTALSSHEVAQGYKSITEPSVYIKFKVKSGQKIGNFTTNDNTYILSWTTTPWTLPGNVALAVGGDIEYVKVKRFISEWDSNKEAVYDEVILSKKIYNELKADPVSIKAKPFNFGFTKILNGFELPIDYSIEDLQTIEFKGSDLIGVEYEPLFPGAIPESVENYQNAFKVYEADFVTTEDGTGIVHTAVMYGEDDYQLGSQVGLPKHHTVDENGNFQATVKKWAGQFVKDKKVEQGIIEDLKNRNLLFTIEDYTHDYPFCWRCDTPLLYYAKNSWFIKMSALQKDLIKENQKINWIPEHIKEGRFGEWLAQVKDWAISRERYWGTPLPIWQCEQCEEIKVIGSYQELYEETQCPLIQKDDFDPHRPFIDEYKLKCQCGGQMSRVPEVADRWFDSGSMPFAQHHYPFENKEKIESKDYYPADFIAEAIDQTRGWFYTMLAIGVLVERGTSYKNVICLGHINDSEGRKMSKRIGNIIDPMEVINKWGADALRFHLYTVNQPGESKNFDIKNVESAVRKNFIILFNVLNFYQMYQGKSQFIEKQPKIKNVLDEWALAKLNQLTETITKNLDEYNIFSAGRSITDFIDELSTWYLRRSRDRFKGDDQKDKELAMQTLGYCLSILSKLMAPFTPFVAEELYQKLGGQLESAHLESWPKAEKYNENIIKEMDKVRKIVELALAKRDEAGVKVRQPLNQLIVTSEKLSEELVNLIKDEVNVKEVVFEKGETLAVKLDSKLTDELKEEGMYRELVRSINQLRKEENFNITNSARLFYYTDSNYIDKVIEKYKDDLLKNTISIKIKKQFRPDVKGKEITINGEKIWLGIKPWS